MIFSATNIQEAKRVYKSLYLVDLVCEWPLSRALLVTHVFTDIVVTSSLFFLILNY